MNFDFQVMKDILQKDFDRVLANYPTDFSALRNKIPTGGDAYERKRIILETAAEYCPVRLFGHFPFACVLDGGEPRGVTYRGLGNVCREKSGVDFSPLSEFRSLLKKHNLGPFNDYTDHLHRTFDHDKLLAVGFRGVYEECMRLNRDETDAQKKRWRELVMTACLAVQKIGLRLRSLAEKELETEQDEDIRYNLRRIADSVNTPWEPPVTMFDALNAILSATQFISCMDGVNAHSYGQIDRLILPYYERDLAEGRITDAEAYYLLQCFLAKTDLHIHFGENRTNFDNGVSVMIGGCDPQGNPVYNRITDMILDAYTENHLIHPKLNARASTDSPLPYLKRLSALMLRGGNNVIIENDDYIIPMFERMGLSPEDARTYSGNGCQEVICRNQLHSRAFVYLNMPQVLLDSLQYDTGTLPEGLQKIYRSGSFHTDSFEDVYASFLANLRSFIGTVAAEFAPFERIHHTINPEPMLSAFTADCVARGRDIAEGGARYNHKTIALVGFGTLCDSLLSLRTAYENGTQNDLLEAMYRNFEGSEALRLRLQSGPERFGHSPEADRFAARLADDLAQVSRGICNARGIEWRTSLFTYYQFQRLGTATAATPDGRRAGEAFSRQMNMSSMPVLTAAAQSMAVLCDADFNDVGMFDFVLPCTPTDSVQMTDTLTDYIRTCLSLRIPVLQTNCTDRRKLTEARDSSETDPSLVVRVCGYSAIFGYLSKDMQNEIIDRTGT